MRVVLRVETDLDQNDIPEVIEKALRKGDTDGVLLEFEVMGIFERQDSLNALSKAEWEKLQSEAEGNINNSSHSAVIRNEMRRILRELENHENH